MIEVTHEQAPRYRTRDLRTWLLIPLLVSALVASPVAGKGIQVAQAVAEIQFQAFRSAGVDALERKDYAAAIDFFEQALAYDPENAEMQKLLTFSAFEAGRYEQAIQYAEAFLAANEDSDVLFMLARSYEAIGAHDSAEQAYAKLATRTGDIYELIVRDRLSRYAERMPTAVVGGRFPRPEGFTGLITAGIEYDDNIATAVNPATDLPEEIQDIGLAATGALDYDMLMGYSYFVGIGGLGFGQWYQDDGSEFDLQFLRVDGHVGLVGSDWSWEVAVEYDHVNLDYETAIRSWRLATSFVHIFDSRWVPYLQASVGHDDFPQNKGQDATQAQLHFRNRIYSPKLRQDSYIQLNYRFLFNGARDQDPFSYYAHRVAAGAFVPLVYEFDLTLDGSYEWRPFFQSSSPQRTDQTFTTTLTLGYEFKDDWRAEASYRFLKRNSSDDIFDKDQNVYAFRAIHTF